MGTSPLLYTPVIRDPRSLHQISPRQNVGGPAPVSEVSRLRRHRDLAFSLWRVERRFRGPEAGPPLSRPHTHRLFHMTDFQGARR